jgi:hypothetical protein
MNVADEHDNVLNELKANRMNSINQSTVEQDE